MRRVSLRRSAEKTFQMKNVRTPTKKRRNTGKPAMYSKTAITLKASAYWALSLNGGSARFSMAVSFTTVLGPRGRHQGLGPRRGAFLAWDALGLVAGSAFGGSQGGL